jgi:DNA-binding NarL/FixJ family response regulator
MSGKNKDQIQVLVVASSQAMRAGLRSLLSADGSVHVTGEAASLPDLGAYRWRDVEVVIQADEDNTASTYWTEFQAGRPDSEPLPALLLLSDEALSNRFFADLPLRAWGVLPVDASTEELSVAVHALHEGLIVAAPHLLNHLLASRSRPGETLSFNPSDQLLVEKLTPRETEVLQLLAQGLANKQIAALLSISEHTVKFHVSSIYAKLGATNRTEAVRIGARQGLILL